MIYSRPTKTTSIVTMAHCLDKEDWKRESSWKVEHPKMCKKGLEDRLVAISKDQKLFGVPCWSTRILIVRDHL